MKKLTVLLISFTLLLSGCNSDTSSISETDISEGTSQTSSSATSASSATDAPTSDESSAPNTEDISEETLEALPEGYDYIVPKRSGLEAQLIVDKSKELNLTEIAQEVGYEFEGIDLESDEMYVNRRERIEANYTGEELEEYRSRNYCDLNLGSICKYIGSDQVDWVFTGSYNFQSMRSYTRIVLVKDGEIIYKSDVIDLDDWHTSGNKLFAPAMDKGLCVFDIDKRELSYIDTADDGKKIVVGQYGIFRVFDERYVIFQTDPTNDSEREAYLYDNTDGSITLLKDFLVYENLGNVFTFWRYKITDGKLYRYKKYIDIQQVVYSVYDLVTQEYTLLETDDFTDAVYLKSGDYIVTSADKSSLGAIHLEAVVVSRRSDGAEKAFDLRKYLSSDGDAISSLFSKGDWLYIYTTDGDKFALNFETESIADLTGDLKSYCLESNNGHLWYRYWEESDDVRTYYVAPAEFTIPQPILLK